MREESGKNSLHRWQKRKSDWERRRESEDGHVVTKLGLVHSTYCMVQLGLASFVVREESEHFLLSFPMTLIER